MRSLAEIEAEVVYEAAYGLIAGRYAFGDPGSARELATEMAGRARVGRDRRFEAIFRLTRAHLDLRVDGAYEAMIAEAHRVLADAEGHARGLPGDARHGDRARRARPGPPGARRLPAWPPRRRSAARSSRCSPTRSARSSSPRAARRRRWSPRARPPRPPRAAWLRQISRVSPPAGRSSTSAPARPCRRCGRSRSPRSPGPSPRARRCSLLAGGDAAGAVALFQRAAQRWEGYSLARALRSRLGAGLAELVAGPPRRGPRPHRGRAAARARARARARRRARRARAATRRRPELGPPRDALARRADAARARRDAARAGGQHERPHRRHPRASAARPSTRTCAPRWPRPGRARACRRR